MPLVLQDEHRYQVSCDGCGAPATAAAFDSLAQLAAHDEGFHVVGPSQWLCWECLTREFKRLVPAGVRIAGGCQ